MEKEFNKFFVCKLVSETAISHAQNSNNPTHVGLTCNTSRTSDDSKPMVSVVFQEYCKGGADYRHGELHETKQKTIRYEFKFSHRDLIDIWRKYGNVMGFNQFRNELTNWFKHHRINAYNDSVVFNEIPGAVYKDYYEV